MDEPDESTLSGNGGGARPVGAPELARGATVGRYVVVERVASGGMGVVYAAFDYALERKVALKRVHPVADREQRRELQARLELEARAMARLSHPNINAVFDVVLDREDQLYVAMEWGECGTLADWLEAAPRSQREVLDAFLQAGRGLEAAHRAGFIHRDFKPQNVLLGADGRFRVCDFGLADDSSAPGARPRPSSEQAVGTPRYMAPESFRGEQLAPAADQYGFCVALKDGLKGTGRTPTWLARLLARGLAPEPAARFPSMGDLLGELERRRARRPRLRLLGLGAALALGAYALLREAPADRCAEAGSAAAAIWTEPRRTELQSALGARRWPAQQRALEAYFSRYAALSRQVCAATRVRQVQPEAERANRQACLDAHLRRAQALVEVLSRPEPNASSWPSAPLEVLPQLDDCVSLAQPGPSERGSVDPAALAELRLLLNQAWALDAAARFREAGVVVERALADAHAQGAVCAEAEAQELKGELQVNSSVTGREGVTTLRDALVLADACPNEEPALRAHLRLAWVLTGQRDDYEEADRHLRHARALLARRGGGDLYELRLALAQGRLQMARGDMAGARQTFEAALARGRTRVGPEHPRMLILFQAVADTWVQSGRLKEGRAPLEQLLPVQERVMGLDHPSTVTTLRELAHLRLELGEPAEALALAQRAYAGLVRTYGEEHTMAAAGAVGVAAALTGNGRYAEALAQLAAARTVFEKSNGPRSPAVALVDNNLGETLLAQGARDDAGARFAAADAVYEAQAPAHPHRVVILSHLGEVQQAQGHSRQARATCERALAIAGQTLGKDVPAALPALRCLGLLALAEGAVDQAEALLARAVALAESSGGEARDVALARFGLAKARAELPGASPAQLRVLVDAARAALGSRADGEPLVREMDAWRARRLTPAAP